MALIKCTECGHDVSDKASECPHCGCPISQENGSVCKECGIQLPKDATVCPNCGCPTDNTKAVKIVYYDEEPPKKKKKRWIWALVVALICLLVGGGYYTYVYFTNKSLGNTESTDSSNDKDAIVEITPEFIEALEEYDELAPFSEGYAAVQRGQKWGYINTKGEEVIACSFDNAGFFSEGLSAVCQDERWGFIDTNGNIVIPMEYEEEPTPFSEGLAGIKRNNKFGWINTKGQEIIQPLTDAIAVGQFSEGLVFVLESYEDFMFLDKEGNVKFKGKCDSNFYFNLTFPSLCKEFPRFHNGLVYVANPQVYPEPQKFTQFDKYGNKLKILSKLPNDLVHFAQSEIGEETSVVEVLVNAAVNSFVGLKDADGNIVIPAQYDRVYTHFSNGVFLVALFDDENEFYWGYADLKGNDSFTNRVKQKCLIWRRQEQQMEDENLSMYQEDESSETNGFEYSESASMGGFIGTYKISAYRQDYRASYKTKTKPTGGFTFEQTGYNTPDGYTKWTDYVVVHEDGRVVKISPKGDPRFIGKVKAINRSAFTLIEYDRNAHIGAYADLYKGNNQHVGHLLDSGFELWQGVVFDLNGNKVYRKMSDYENRDIQASEYIVFSHSSIVENSNDTEYIKEK